MEYAIKQNGKQVGVATMTQIGLYYRIHCVCCVNKAGLYRVRLKGDQFERDLGTCLKTTQGYEITTRIPTKELEGKNYWFRFEESSVDDGTFIPLNTEKAFPHISQLMNARFACRDGIFGILIPKSSR